MPIRKSALAAIAAAIICLASSLGNAQAKTCYVQAGAGESGGHVSQRAARAAAWANWQSRMRTKYNKRFSYVRAETVSGYPKLQKVNRRWKAQIRAFACETTNALCMGKVGGPAECGCHTSWKAARDAGCDVWQIK